MTLRNFRLKLINLQGIKAREEKEERERGFDQGGAGPEDRQLFLLWQEEEASSSTRGGEKGKVSVYGGSGG